MRKMKRTCALLLMCALLLGLLCGCAGKNGGYVGQLSLGKVTIEDEAAILASAPAAIPVAFMPEPSGKATKSKNSAVIDYSNVTDGYVMCQYQKSTEKRLKVQVEGPTTKYTYDLVPGNWATFPLSDGNGAYKVGIYQNVSGSKYSKITSVSFNVKLQDEFAPFLRPNQYVNYEYAVKTVEKAGELTRSKTDVLDKVAAIYDYVVDNFTYDDELAATVTSGYLPNLEKVLASKKGICFDYAALMVGMLRSQEIPCKLIVGYAGSVYHAWLSVYSEKDGWIDGAVFFDGKTWMRMDPTFASTGGNSKAIQQYIGDGSNYTAKYFY